MINKIGKIRDTYSIVRKLSVTNNSDISKAFLDRVMYNIEKLPPLGKEYWWFLFFDDKGEKPAQLMLMICRTYGKKMIFNGKEMILKDFGTNKIQAVTTAWFYDGQKLNELGDTNAITEIQGNKIISEISGQKVVFSGSFPNYKLKIGNIVDLDIKKSQHLYRKETCGGFFPPFGMGWINIDSDVEGTVFGKKFKGKGHLQKVIGVTLLGPFNWGRILFKNGSVARFFYLKARKNSKRYFRTSIDFYDHPGGQIIKFDNPKINVSKRDDFWIIHGKDYDKNFQITLEAYAHRQFTMKGYGLLNYNPLNYNEYAVVPREFHFRTKDRKINLNDLGGGVGTFEDTYW